MTEYFYMITLAWMYGGEQTHRSVSNVLRSERALTRRELFAAVMKDAAALCELDDLSRVGVLFYQAEANEVVGGE